MAGAVMTTTLLEDLTFAEAPRWHNGELWFSDFFDEKVYRYNPVTGLQQVVTVPGRPSGLGWNRQGELLIVGMETQALFRFDGDQLSKIADLSAYARLECNDMVVSDRGDCYIGNFGFDFTKEAPRSTNLIRVNAAGRVSVAAEDMLFPNGCIIKDDGQTLVVAETFASRLTAFDIASDGSLSGRRVYADLEGYFPDGIGADNNGGIWVATPTANAIVRVDETGAISHKLALEQDSFACVVGEDQLYICTAGSSVPEACKAKRWGKIQTIALSNIM